MTSHNPRVPYLTFTVRSDLDKTLQLRKALKHIAIEANKSMNQLLLEALEDLIIKYSPRPAASEEVAS